MGTGYLVAMKLECTAGREHCTTPELLPSSDQGRQERDGSARIAAPFVASHPVTDLDKTRSAGRILANHRFNRHKGNIAVL